MKNVKISTSYCGLMGDDIMQSGVLMEEVCFSIMFGHSTCWLVKLLLAFASTVIPGFSLKIHDQHTDSLLDMCMFQNGASSLMKEGSVFLCRCYICCTVSAEVYLCCHVIQVTMDSVHLLSLPYTK
jgi:hypothetical protein